MKGILGWKLKSSRLAGHDDLENVLESGSVTNDSISLEDQIVDSTFTKCHSNGSDGPPQHSNSTWNFFNGKRNSKKWIKCSWIF